MLPIARRRCTEGQLSLQALFNELHAVPLLTTPEEEDELDDWDTPEDIAPRANEPS